MRCAAYIRVSTEEQTAAFSLDAQRRAVVEWIAKRQWQLAETYVDEQSGRTPNRAAFQAMLQDARKGAFDAVVIHQFDRFARNYADALAIKFVLRHDCGIQVHSTREASSDSDGVHGMIAEVFADTFAERVSDDTSERTIANKRERVLQGFHNNRPPHGMTKNEQGILIAADPDIESLRLAFELYATGAYTDGSLAKALNERGYLTREGKPFSKEMVRDMLKNRTYLGEVRYRHRPTMKKSDIEWLKGQHDAVISQDLFDQCQRVREQKATLSGISTPKYNAYLLRDLIYCQHCVTHKPNTINNPNFGKMRPKTMSLSYYRCMSQEDWGFDCPQVSILTHLADEQVIDVLQHLSLSPEQRQQVIDAIAQDMGNRKIEARIAEIKAIVKRMEFGLYNGLITDMEEFVAQRRKLQAEIEALTPLVNDERDLAADVIDHFATHWQVASTSPHAQEQLIHLLVTRVEIRDSRAVSVTLKAGIEIKA